MRKYFDFCAKPLEKVEVLTAFERDIDKERSLDRQLVVHRRGDAFSVHFFCEKLSVLVERSNQSLNERWDLFHFLSANHLQSLTVIQGHLPHNDYIPAVKEYLSYLHRTLDIVHWDPVVAPLDRKIEEIIGRYINNSGDISRAFPASDYWDVRKAACGHVMIDRNINFYLCDSLSGLYDTLNHEVAMVRSSIIFLLQPVDPDDVTDIFLEYLPLRLVVIENNKSKIYLDAMTGFRKTFFQLARSCDALRAQKYVPDRLSSQITELAGYLEYILSRIEKHFSVRWDNRLRDRDFMLIVAKLKSFAYDLQHAVTGQYYSQTESISHKLTLIADALYRSFVQSSKVHELPKIVYSGVLNIARNADLYRISGTAVKADGSTLFGENNLTAALATWLDGRVHGHNMTIQREEQTGNGRTDITIFSNAARVSIIECKLFKHRANESLIAGAIKKGIYQLFDKYSFSVVQSVEFPPRLYLVLFSFDPEYQLIRDRLQGVLLDINSDGILTVVAKQPETKGWLHYSIMEGKGNYPAKEILLDIMLVGLRTQDDSDRLHGKYR